MTLGKDKISFQSKPWCHIKQHPQEKTLPESQKNQIWVIPSGYVNGQMVMCICVYVYRCVSMCIYNKAEFWWKTEHISPRIFKRSLCPLFFIKLSFFHQMIAIQKLWKMFVISSKKLFFFWRYLHFCNSPLPFHTFQIQKDE